MNDMSSIRNALESLGKSVKQTGSGKYQCQCPCHDDNKASLTVTDGGDKILIHCHAGCKYNDITKALGINSKESYNYRDRKNNTRYTINRTPNKVFPVTRPDGQSGLNGEAKIPYRLPELLASDKKDWVFIPEGEKDCDTLACLGLTATTNPFGAGKWCDEFNEYLKGRKVVLLPDNDETGREHMQSIARSLFRIVKEIRIVELDDLPEKGDVSDWMGTGGTIEGLMLRVDETKSFKPESNRKLQSKRLSEVEPKKVQWLQPEIIPLAMVTSVVAQEGVGKSTVASDIIARVTTGSQWPNAPGIDNPKGDVILFNHEEAVAEVLVPRLMANGAELSRIHLAENVVNKAGEESFFDIESNIEQLDDIIDEFPGTRLVIFDPINSYVSCNENSNKEVRQALKPLVDFAARRNVAVLVLSHLNKKVGIGFINRTIGSRAWSAVPRLVWGIKEQIEDDGGDKVSTGYRLLLNIKCNIGPKPQGLKFAIGDNATVIWDSERVDFSMDDVLAKTLKIEEATEWLRERLSEGKTATSKTLFAEGEKFGYSEKMLHRAKKVLGIKACKSSFGGEGHWFWKMPEEATGAENEDT
ncbi:MAG: AAA family ATPase [Phycisphaerae bacterium]|nr:AAA family ATPase [Phycisphaerae bacterium]